MFIYDLIKLKYSQLGYLPDYPYHLISDKEMCNAFYSEDSDICYFKDNYPLIDKIMQKPYEKLIEAMEPHLNEVKRYYSPTKYILPDWICSYMLGVVIGPNSDKQDIHNLLVLMNLDNIEDDFNLEALSYCYQVSEKWITKLQATKEIDRPPTMFGEPHVIKSLRLMAM